MQIGSANRPLNHQCHRCSQASHTSAESSSSSVGQPPNVDLQTFSSRLDSSLNHLTKNLVAVGLDSIEGNQSSQSSQIVKNQFHLRDLTSLS